MSSIHELKFHHVVDLINIIIKSCPPLQLQLYCTVCRKQDSMHSKQQLKPLLHKKIPNGIEHPPKTPLSKEFSKGEPKQSPSPAPKTVLAKKPSNGETIKPVKYSRSAQRSTKTIEHYECDDFGLEVEDNNYFQSQLEKNIKTQILSKTGKPQAKAQIVLPKLESDTKCRNMKELEREMDEEMSKMMDCDYGNAYD